MSLFEKDEKVQIVKWYFRGNSYREIIDLFTTTFPNRPPPAIHTVFRTVKNFEKYGCVTPRCHRKSKKNKLKKMKAGMSIEKSTSDDDDLKQSSDNEIMNKSAIEIERMLFQEHVDVKPDTQKHTVTGDDYKIDVPEFVYLTEVKKEPEEIIHDEIEATIANVSSMKPKTLKLNEFMGDEITQNSPLNNVKPESYEINYYLNCDTCGKEYEWVCARCPMISHILNTNVSESCPDRPKKTIPRNILAICNLVDSFGVFALKPIPKGIKFGPFEGLQSIRCTIGSAWQLENGKPVLADNGNRSNWMQYVNCVRDISAKNLVVFQYENNLYYRSDRDIKIGEELLVYSSGEDSQAYYYPAIEKSVQNVYACTFCCMGFSSEVHLLKHIKTRCPCTSNKGSSFEDAIQCPFCNVDLNKVEYSGHHLNYCRENYNRNFAGQMIDQQLVQQIYVKRSNNSS